MNVKLRSEIIVGSKSICNCDKDVYDIELLRDLIK